MTRGTDIKIRINNDEIQLQKAIEASKNTSDDEWDDSEEESNNDVDEANKSENENGIRKNDVNEVNESENESRIGKSAVDEVNESENGKSDVDEVNESENENRIGKRLRSLRGDSHKTKDESGDLICECCTFQNDCSDTKSCQMCLEFRNDDEAQQQRLNNNLKSILGEKFDLDHINFVRKYMKEENLLNQVSFLQEQAENDVRTKNPRKFLKDELNFRCNAAELFTFKYSNFKLFKTGKPSFLESKWASMFQLLPFLCKNTIMNYLCLKDQFELVRTSKRFFCGSNYGEYFEIKTKLTPYEVTFDGDKHDHVSIELKIDAKNFGYINVDEEKNKSLAVKIGKIRFILPSNSGWHECTIEGWVNFPNLGVQLLIPRGDSVGVLTRRLEQMKYYATDPKYKSSYVSNIEVKPLSNYKGPALLETCGNLKSSVETTVRIYKRAEKN